jgi:hypothetical protein
MTIYVFLLISRSVLQDFLHQAQRPLWIWPVQRPRSDIAGDLYVRRLTRLARLGQSRVEIPNVLEAFRLKSSEGNRWTAHIAQKTFFLGLTPDFSWNLRIFALGYSMNVCAAINFLQLSGGPSRLIALCEKWLGSRNAFWTSAFSQPHSATKSTATVQKGRIRTVWAMGISLVTFANLMRNLHWYALIAQQNEPNTG